MYVCLYMYVCMCMYVCILYMYVCMYECIVFVLQTHAAHYICMYVLYMYVCMHACILYMYVYVCISYMYVCVYVCMYTCNEHFSRVDGQTGHAVQYVGQILRIIIADFLHYTSIESCMYICMYK